MEQTRSRRPAFGSGIFAERARLAALGQEALGLRLIGGKDHPDGGRIATVEGAAHLPYGGAGITVAHEDTGLLRRPRWPQPIDEIGHAAAARLA